jgi:hypothetical protein
MMTDTDRAPALSITANAVSATTVLRALGVLNGSTYIPLRDKIIEAALNEPSAVVIDVTELDVPEESAWAAVSSARWLVSRWPQIPIALVCRYAAGRDALIHSGVLRHVPMYPTLDAAVVSLPCWRADRHRARAELPGTAQSLRRSRELVAGWLTAWSQTELIPVTKIIATTFVENVLQHTASDPCVRLESDGSVVTVAVEDSSTALAMLHEGVRRYGAPSGLRIVSALCRMWGNAPMPSGKTVWAVIGQENRL